MLSYLQCFQQRPFLKLSEKTYKFKISIVMSTNNLSDVLLFALPLNYLLTMVHQGLTRKFLHGSTKEVQYHCKFKVISI